MNRLFASMMLCSTVSCSLGENYLLTDEELERFERAGPIRPELDTDRILSGTGLPGLDPYRVVTGDLLAIQGPRTFLADQDGGGEDQFRLKIQRGHLARVDADGAITIPIVGKQVVKGKTLVEIEAAIAKGVFPRYLKKEPSIVAQVVDYQKAGVTVIGAVEKPGIVRLRSDELSLFGALTASGGIQRTKSNYVAGARLIRIRRPGEQRAEAMILPVKGLNVPLGNVALTGGEVIEVERWEPDTFTVVGLVAKPGSYDYPPDTKYNLMQALATAGGVDMTANPPYATVFRKDANGRILPATFDIAGVGLVQSSALAIKPGDVIVVQHTAASWSRSLMAEIFRIQFGFFLDKSTLD